MFYALRDLRRGFKRFILLGIVISLVALLSTILSGLSTGLVTDGISGLRALSADKLAFEPGAKATFSRSILKPKDLKAFSSLHDVESSPIGASFVNATPQGKGPSLDLALFGVPADSFLVTRADAKRALSGPPGLVLAHELQDEGVKIGDVYMLGGSEVKLPVIGFTFAGTYGHAPIAFVSLDTWQQIQYGNQSDGRFSAIALRGDSSAIEKAGKQAGLEVLTKSQTYQGSPGFTAETTTMSLIRMFLLIISALVVGAFFTVLMVQRTRQVGIIKAMGASNTYIVKDSVGQMSILVTFSTFVGIAIGIVVVILLGKTKAPVELDLSSIATVAILLILSGVIGSIGAVRRITQVEPAIALGVEQ